jgi:hypothetical protein
MQSPRLTSALLQTAAQHQQEQAVCHHLQKQVEQVDSVLVFFGHGLI